MLIPLATCPFALAKAAARRSPAKPCPSPSKARTPAFAPVSKTSPKKITPTNPPPVFHNPFAFVPLKELLAAEGTASKKACDLRDDRITELGASLELRKKKYADERQHFQKRIANLERLKEREKSASEDRGLKIADGLLEAVRPLTPNTRKAAIAGLESGLCNLRGRTFRMLPNRIMDLGEAYRKIPAAHPKQNSASKYSFTYQESLGWIT